MLEVGTSPEVVAEEESALDVVVLVELTGEDVIPEAVVVGCEVPQVSAALGIPKIAEPGAAKIDVADGPDIDAPDVAAIDAELDGTLMPLPSKLGIAAVFAEPREQAPRLPAPAPKPLALCTPPAANPASSGEVDPMAAGTVEPVWAKSGLLPGAVMASANAKARKNFIASLLCKWLCAPRCACRSNARAGAVIQRLDPRK